MKRYIVLVPIVLSLVACERKPNKDPIVGLQPENTLAAKPEKVASDPAEMKFYSIGPSPKEIAQQTQPATAVAKDQKYNLEGDPLPPEVLEQIKKNNEKRAAQHDNEAMADQLADIISGKQSTKNKAEIEPKQTQNTSPDEQVKSAASALELVKNSDNIN